MAKKTLDKLVIDQIQLLGGLQSVYRGLKETTDYDRRAQLYNIFSALMVNKNPFERVDPLSLAEKMDKFDAEGRVLHINENLATYASTFEPVYKANQKEITKTVESRLNAAMKGKKDMPHAVDALLPYLAGILSPSKMSQEEADRSYRGNLYNQHQGRLFAGYHIGGNVEAARVQELRNRATEYIKKTAKKGGTQYTVDNAKLNALMDDALTGSVLYSTATAPKKKKSP